MMSMKKIKFILPALILLGAFISCSKETEPEESSNIPKVIVDTDLGSSTDDVMSILMLYQYMNEGRVDLQGLIIDRLGEMNAQSADIINNYYKHPEIPIGLAKDGPQNPTIFIDYSPLLDELAESNPTLYKRSVKDYSTIPEDYVLYRKLLAACDDSEMIIIAIGFTNSLVHLLKSEPDEYSQLNGIELVKKKVKTLYIQGGNINENPEPDFNFLAAREWAKDYKRLWPKEVPVIYNTMSAGQYVDYRPEVVMQDFDSNKDNLLYQVYSQRNCDTGQRMWDPMGVIRLLEGDKYLTLTEKGNMVIDNDANTSFHVTQDGNDRCIQDPDSITRVNLLNLIRTKVQALSTAQ